MVWVGLREDWHSTYLLICSIDILLLGHKCTWANAVGATKLDRFMVSSEWPSTFPGLKFWAFLQGLSDHTPLFLDSVPVNWGPQPFWFLDFWFQLSDFKNDYSLVGISRREYVQPLLCGAMLRHIKILLKEWHKWHVHNLEAATDRWEAELDSLDRN